ncbi:hypothetical protein JOC85_002572 [Bacillus mesophilus]|uniref:Plasmid pRiA4b ORF-3 family protein n=1 Tax=Bacillus mesophilus TaxID=1808955 RepID=A0A6M0Q825_9BACI|nr:plasmid pRiA4b ORF-3 family protein [Bacillus mesophilus]MBM7661769.1 hypothetical protein [Bacillus mesophilus]NEY72427.1 plasmid pRiA4b ORF-3 family protein [Bacillus mesophilus]
MLIQCTKKLLSELKLVPETTADAEPLFSWHANLLTINRRKTLVLMNDSNRYVIVLHGLKAKDIKNIEVLILEAIRETFRDEGIKDEVIEAFISSSKKFTYTTTKDRTMVARLNKACENVLYFEEDLIQQTINQVKMNKRISRFLVGNGKKDYRYPNQDLYRDLEVLAGEAIFYSEALVLHVKLNLKNHHVWRKVMVPKRITFPELHETLQIVFGWKDYHLHEFITFKENLERQPIVRLVCHEEALNHPSRIPMRIETGEKLVDYLPAKISYLYDFGEGWEHEIIIENERDDYDQNFPVCIDGGGNTPPEDVGGEYGYEAFLKIISNPNHPEHSFMVSWGISQGYSEFDIDMINRSLKSM